jgi:CxxC-x17-CxxC domain-containing protein
MPNTTDDAWRAFQERVADLFSAIPNCTVSVGERLHGARIGTVEVDVVARFRAQPAGRPRHRHLFEFLVIIECKFWRKKIPQEKIFALKTIVEDVGAARGILVSEVGVQKGITEYLRAPNNIEVLTFTQLVQSFASGDFFATCAKCGGEALRPFKIDPHRTTLCYNCLRAQRQYLFPPTPRK